MPKKTTKLCVLYSNSIMLIVLWKYMTLQQRIINDNTQQHY